MSVDGQLAGDRFTDIHFILSVRQIGGGSKQQDNCLYSVLILTAIDAAGSLKIQWSRIPVGMVVPPFSECGQCAQ